MTLTAARALGWDFESRLTSDEINHLQAELLKAIDGTGGGTYTLGSDLIFEGAAARFRGILAVEDDGSFVVTDDATWLLAGSGEISGDYILSGDGDIEGILRVLEDGAIRIEEAGLLRVSGDGFFVAAAGSSSTFGGTVTFTGTSSVSFGSTLVDLSTIFNVLSGARIDIESGGKVSVLSGGSVEMSNGALLKVDDADDIELNFSSYTFRLTLTPASMTSEGGVPQFKPFIGRPVWQVTNSAGTGNISDVGSISFGLPLLPGDRITTIRTTLTNVSSGVNPHSNVPANRPRLQLIAVNINGGETVLAETEDPVTTLPAYDDSHSITLSNATNITGPSPGSFFPYVVPTSSLLLVRVYNEWGANALANSTAVCSIDGTAEAMHYRNTSEIY